MEFQKVKKMEKKKPSKKTLIEQIKADDLIKKEINQFSQSLSKDQKNIIDETKKLVESRSDNLVGGDTTDSQLVFNFGYRLKDALPLNNFVRGTDYKNFKQVNKFDTKSVKRFTDVVLCVAMGKNAKEVKENDGYFYRVLRDIAVSVIYELKYQVIKPGTDGKFFDTPIGRQPKKMFISFSDINKIDKLKNKYSGGKPADYVPFSTFNAIANYRLLGKAPDGDNKSTLLKKLESLQDYLVDNKILSQDSMIRQQELSAIDLVVSDLLIMLDNAQQYTNIADTLTFITDSERDADKDEKVRLVNFHKHIGEIEFVKYDKMKKAKSIFADTGESFLKQVKSI